MREPKEDIKKWRGATHETFQDFKLLRFLLQSESTDSEKILQILQDFLAEIEKLVIRSK